MGRLKWYKRDPDAALSGMFELTLEERGAYNTVLDLIYSRDGELPDDDRWIAGWMRCDVRVWRRIKARLIEAGKLYVSCMKLRNQRADATILEGLSMVGSRTEAGRTGGIKSGEVRRKNKDLDEANTEANANTTTATTRIREDVVVVGARARGIEVLREVFPDLDRDLALPSLAGTAGMIDSWIGDGADLDRDILPAIRRLAAERRRKQRGPPRTFGYFAQAVADARQANTEPLPDARPPTAPTVNGHDRAADRERAAREGIAAGVAAGYGRPRYRGH